MPDGDIVHNRPRPPYQKPYKSLCEGKATPEECVLAVAKALKEDLRSKGDLPILLAQNIGEKLNQIFGRSDSIDWLDVNRECESLVWKADGPPYLKELLLRAAKSFLHDVRYQRNMDIVSAPEAILQRYMHEVYEAEFKGRIPLVSEHHAGVDHATLEKRIEQMQPDIEAVISKWARKANIDGSVAKMRLPPRPQVNTVDMDEDLLAS